MSNGDPPIKATRVDVIFKYGDSTTITLTTIVL